MADSWDEFKSELAKRGVHLEFVYKDKERTKVQGIRFCKDGYSFKGTQISRDYSFGKLNARFEGTENLLSASANSAQQYEQGCCKNEQEPAISESSQDPWDGISSIGLFASANAQTFEQFPEDELSLIHISEPTRQAVRTLGTVFLPYDFLLLPMHRPLSNSQTVSYTHLTLPTICSV